MTKQEYEAMLADIIEKFPSEETPHPAKVMCEYIASLEAENAKKDKLLDILLSKLAYFGCPSGDVLLTCDKNSEDNACIACWHKYLMQESDAQKELT